MFKIQNKAIPNRADSHLASILHYVRHAWPLQAGYTIRTQYVASNLAKMGYKISVANCIDNDVTASASQASNVKPRMKNDDVTYYRPFSELFNNTLTYSMVRKLSQCRLRGMTRLRKKMELPVYLDWIIREIGKPDIIHAHSNAGVAKEALQISKRLRIPMIYEIRGFWSLSIATDNHTAIHISKAIRDDVRIARKSDHVVAISDGIADQLIREGISASKISIVPNGVDVSIFHPIKKDFNLAQKINVNDKFVFGYATNVRYLEGLQNVIEAWPNIIKEIPNALFLLIGDGNYLDNLKAMVEKLGIENSFRFIGRILHKEILFYYSLFDVFVVPRIPEPVCEIVTPLKPLEAMAMGIPVIASNVGGLREMVRDRETGILFRAGDIQELSKCCIELGTNPSSREAISFEARKWIRQNRDWKIITSQYKNIYDSVLSRRGGS